MNAPPRHRSLRLRLVRAVVWFAVVYVVAAYLLIPLAWERYARRHPAFDSDPRITKTGDGHPGDPLNVAVIGSQVELHGVMQAAGWKAATALGLWSDLKIAGDTVLERPDEQAPVSRLYLFDRVEDFAYEKPAGDSPRERHHVRFWRTPWSAEDKQPAWLGSASFDRGVGLSRTTGQVTHHIEADVDRERDALMKSLEETGLLSEEYAIDDFHSVRQGLNGGGDLWRTDGQLRVGIVAEGVVRGGGDSASRGRGD
jgi:hypothetical protein